jgi:hypothetical protein
MLKLLKDFLAQYQLDASPLVAPILFLILLFLLRWILVALATSQVKNLVKEDRKLIHKHFRQRAGIGWLLWFTAWILLVMAYFEMLPPLLQEKMYLWPAVGILFLISLSLHFLAYAQSAIQTLNEKKNLTLVS